MTPEQKQWIDEASYEDLIEKIRSEPVNSPWFKDGTDEYLMGKLKERVESLIEHDSSEYPEFHEL